MYFQPLSFDQNNPFLTGMKGGEQLVGGALNNQATSLANQLAKIQLPFAAPTAQAQLQGKQLANALDQNTLNYAPQMSQADLAYKQAQPGLIRAQTGEANAQTGLIGQQTKYYGMDELIKAQQANQSSSRFGPAYQLAKSLSSMPAATRATWIANNQDAYNQMVTDIANGNNQNQSFLTPQIMQQYFPGAMQQQPQQPQQQANPQMQQVPQQMQPPAQPQMPGAQMQQPGRFAMPTPAQNAQTQQASQMSANQYLTTAATRRQMEGAMQVENIVNDPRIQTQVVNAAQYAGAVGKGSQAISALSQTNPKAYEDYLSLKNQTMPLLENRIKTLDQMGGTDKQREELQGLYNKTMDSLASNSSQFVGQFNELTKTLDTVAKSVQKSATPIFDVNRLNGSNQIANPYQPPNAPSQVQQIGGALNNSSQTKIIGGKTYTKMNGQWYEQ
jgi:hypothetical protein